MNKLAVRSNEKHSIHVIDRSNSADVPQKTSNTNCNHGVVAEIVKSYYIIHVRVCTTF